jgi:hypothetical protein
MNDTNDNPRRMMCKSFRKQSVASNKKHFINSPCTSITYWPIIFELLAIVPRDEPDDEDELVPDLNSILVVCCRSSIVIVSSGVVFRAKGQMKL